jgi:hypothetical protein
MFLAAPVSALNDGDSVRRRFQLYYTSVSSVELTSRITLCAQKRSETAVLSLYWLLNDILSCTGSSEMVRASWYSINAVDFFFGRGGGLLGSDLDGTQRFLNWKITCFTSFLTKNKT